MSHQNTLQQVSCHVILLPFACFLARTSMFGGHHAGHSAGCLPEGRARTLSRQLPQTLSPLSWVCDISESWLAVKNWLGAFKREHFKTALFSTVSVSIHYSHFSCFLVLDLYVLFCCLKYHAMLFCLKSCSCVCRLLCIITRVQHERSM